MLTIVLGWLGNLLGGPIAKAAVDAYRAKLSAENISEKFAAASPRASSTSKPKSANWRRKW